MSSKPGVEFRKRLRCWKKKFRRLVPLKVEIIHFIAKLIFITKTRKLESTKLRSFPFVFLVFRVFVINFSVGYALSFWDFLPKCSGANRFGEVP